MRHFLLPVCLCLSLASPVLAEEEDAPSDLMERGAQMLLEGLLKQLEPTLDEMQGLAERIGPAFQSFIAEMGPALQDLLDQVEDWSAYHPPEMLENGDIIIRRKQPEPEVAPEGEIEI